MYIIESLYQVFVFLLTVKEAV